MPSHLVTSRSPGKSSGPAFNSVSSDTDCSNPFLCPPTSVAAGGRRPRVKSNLRAKKQNFWQGGDNTSSGNRRKIRRGRKIIRKPDFRQVSNEISDDIEATETVPEEEKEVTEQFVLTVRTFATTTPAPYTTEEEAKEFDEFFDSQNDLFVASSTVSSVVFKGSPTPGGWASSPAPNAFDVSGAQVKLTTCEV